MFYVISMVTTKQKAVVFTQKMNKNQSFTVKEIIGSCNEKSRAFFGFRHGWIWGGLVCPGLSALLGLPDE